ncbi:MAG: glucose-1-phosphate adenylyltransferase, partial [Gallionella sp.]
NKHIQRGWSFLNGQFGEFVDLLPAQQRTNDEHWYRGTADAVFQNLDILRANNPEYVLVLAGDHIYKMDYGKVLAFHVEKNADMTVACLEVPVAEATAFGVMATNEESRVVEFAEKPSEPASIPGKPGISLASMGIYVFNTQFLFEQLIRNEKTIDTSHDFGKDMIPHMVKNNRVFAQSYSQSCVGFGNDNLPYWRDVGTIDSYWAANMELTKVQPDLDMYDKEWPIWTRQLQLPPAKFVFDDADRCGAAIDSLISGGCILSGSTIKRSLLFSNVRVNCYCDIQDSVLLPNVNVGKHVTLKKVIVDKNCQIPDGLEVGVNPDKDRQRFHVSASGVTLITPDMLGQEIHFIS